MRVSGAALKVYLSSGISCAIAIVFFRTVRNASARCSPPYDASVASFSVKRESFVTRRSADYITPASGNPIPDGVAVGPRDDREELDTRFASVGTRVIAKAPEATIGRATRARGRAAPRPSVRCGRGREVALDRANHTLDSRYSRRIRDPAETRPKHRRLATRTLKTWRPAFTTSWSDGNHEAQCLFA